MRKVRSERKFENPENKDGLKSDRFYKEGFNNNSKSGKVGHSDDS